LVENRRYLPTVPHFCLAPPLEWRHWHFAEIFGARKLKSLGYRTALFHDPMFNCFDRTPTCDRETEGRTHDNRIYRPSIASRGNKIQRNRWTEKIWRELWCLKTIQRKDVLSKGLCSRPSTFLCVHYPSQCSDLFPFSWPPLSRPRRIVRYCRLQFSDFDTLPALLYVGFVALTPLPLTLIINY